MDQLDLKSMALEPPTGSYNFDTNPSSSTNKENHVQDVADVSYSLWLCSSDKEIMGECQATIDELARMTGTKSFLPHVTLHSLQLAVPHVKFCSRDGVCNCGDQAAFSNVSSIGLELTSFDIRLKALAMHAQNFFQCVFVLVEVDEALSNARAAAAKVVGLRQQHAPHLSLLYSNLPPQEREQLIQAVGPYRFKDKVFHVDRLLLVNTTLPKLSSGTSGNDYSKWQIVHSFELRRRDTTTSAESATNWQNGQLPQQLTAATEAPMVITELGSVAEGTAVDASDNSENSRKKRKPDTVLDDRASPM